ncbi:unnamed protein product [Owenia fusiformis]|uniref:Uncharacterized protein n=1 Tax=Owenia fusiformis TaxID=6347 RepID=A0A8J1U049_OWEFU|nr:unnamed protein product [Owenia fusiformis]
MGKLLSKSTSNNDRYSSMPHHTGVTPSQSTVESDTFRQFEQVHSDAVNSVSAISPGVCLSGSKDKSVLLYDYNTGVVQQVWNGHDKEVTKVAYNNDLHTVFSASRDKTVKLWQANQISPVKTLTGHELVVTALSLNSDNTRLCTGSRDNSLRLWDIHTGSCTLQNAITRNLVTDIKWGKNSHQLVSSSEDKEVRIWDSRTLQVSHSFPRKQYIQTSCDISDDLNYCISSSNGFGGNGCETTLWDMRTLSIVHEYQGHGETVGSCIFMPSIANRNLVATTSNDCSIRVWDRDSAKCLCYCVIPGSGPLTSVSSYPDGRLAVGSFNLGVHIFDFHCGAGGTFSLERKAQY